MSEHLEEFLDLCAGQALGNLDAADRARLEKHLASGCRECETALREFSAASVLLAASAPPVQPSPQLRERVLRAAAESAAAAPEAPGATSSSPDRTAAPGARPGLRAVPPRSQEAELRASPRPTPRPLPRTFWAWTGLAAAACIALLLGLLWTWRTTSRWRAEVSAELEASKRRVTELEQRIEEEQRWAGVMSSPSAWVARLEPTPDAAAAGSAAVKAQAFFDPATHRAVVEFSNLHTPTGRDYQLWAIRGGKPASLGLVEPDPSGYARVRLENAGDPATLAAFALSLEPAGGAPTPDTPTGPVVLVGKLRG